MKLNKIIFSIIGLFLSLFLVSSPIVAAPSCTTSTPGGAGSCLKSDGSRGSNCISSNSTVATCKFSGIGTWCVNNGFTGESCEPYANAGYTTTPNGTSGISVSCDCCGNAITFYKIAAAHPTLYYCDNDYNVQTTTSYSSADACSSATGATCSTDSATIIADCKPPFVPIYFYYCLTASGTCSKSSSQYESKDACQTALKAYTTTTGVCYQLESSCTSACKAPSTGCADWTCSSFSGSCGYSNGGVFSSRPTSGLCDSGETSTVFDDGSGQYYWYCYGGVSAY